MTLVQVVQAKPASPAVVSIGPEQTIQEAIDLLCRYRVGALIVLHPQSGRIVGICSERDVLNSLCSSRRRDPTQALVRDIMTTDVVVAEAHERASTALRVMSERHIRHLPVLDGERLVGVVTIGDVVRDLYEEDEVRIHSLGDYLGGTYSNKVF
jgi:CBS domain-containing protein